MYPTLCLQVDLAELFSWLHEVATQSRLHGLPHSGKLTGGEAAAVLRLREIRQSHSCLNRCVF